MLSFPTLARLQFHIMNGDLPNINKPVSYAFDGEQVCIKADLPLKFKADYKPLVYKEVNTWLEIFPLEKMEQDPNRIFLIQFNNIKSLISLAKEIVNLGNDRLSYCCVDGYYFLKVIDIPYFSLLNALDTCTVYSERRDRLWCKYGYTHPFLEFINSENVLLIGDTFLSFADLKFKDIYEIMHFAVPKSFAYIKCPIREKLTIPVFLKSGANIDPELWITEDYDKVSDYIQENPGANFLFAISGDSILLKAKHKDILPLEFSAFYPKLHNLYVPIGKRIHPPLRKDLLKKLMAPDDNLVYWIEEEVKSISANAFLPISYWIDYVIDHDMSYIKNWMNSCEFAKGA